MNYKGLVTKGILCGVHNQDYIDKNIVKHENVISTKLQDIKEMVRELGIFFSAPSTFASFSPEILQLIEEIESSPPILTNVDQKTIHHIYESTPEQSQHLLQLMQNIPKIYIADGHHRFQTFSEICVKKHIDYFPVILFEQSSLSFFSFQRVFTLPSKMSSNYFVKSLEKFFKWRELTPPPEVMANAPEYESFLSPKKKGEIVMFNSRMKKWFVIEREEEQEEDLLKSLDVFYTDNFLTKVFNCSKKGGEMVFLPGNKFGPKKIERHFEKARDKIIVCTFPIQCNTIQPVADMNKVMPAKSTFMFPKPLEGLFFVPFAQEYF